MPERSRAAAVLGAAAVVLASGVAAYVGAGLAHHDTPPAPPPRNAPPAASSGEWNDRRTLDLEKRVDLVEETARAALELARSRAGAAPDRPAAPAEPPKTAEDGTPRRPDAAEPPAAPKDNEADAQAAALKAIARTTAKNRVVHRMSLFTDATEEGAANRRAQALADARALAHVYGLKGDDVQAELRAAYQDLWDRGARDIGPIVHDGLENADIATVRDRLASIYAETDRRLKPLFDEETWKLYELASQGLRQADGEILDDFEKARLGGK
jgi:hypothetical protein